MIVQVGCEAESFFVTFDTLIRLSVSLLPSKASRRYASGVINSIPAQQKRRSATLTGPFESCVQVCS
jgi:hypothetical protein